MDELFAPGSSAFNAQPQKNYLLWIILASILLIGAVGSVSVAGYKYVTPRLASLLRTVHTPFELLESSASQLQIEVCRTFA